MGEEEKKKKKTESPEAPPDEENKTDNGSEEHSSPPPEIVLRVYMHCEGCARKIQKCLNGFPGVENVKTDMTINQVIVKGEKADPLKVLERVQKKCNREVELISPVPAPPTPPPPEETPEKPVEKAEPENKNEEPAVITAVLGVYMHCDACAQEIRRRILKMKGVESVAADLNNSKVSVKGKFSPENLVDSIFRRTAKHATIISVETEKKEEEKSSSDDKKPDDEEKEKNDGGDPPAEESKIENGIHLFHAPSLPIFTHSSASSFQEEYPPQIFSDENPNACTVA
ncbi:hypothetical protein M569_00741 [Genlisea aurea]|uniref:HMA domain-containing protein n=1 Tax=Genlisea aurea TaxID=192259 RepID=S8D3P2_9LAMI|nr:hypothetical protein M569_00741 [Genlisea aurea]